MLAACTDAFLGIRRPRVSTRNGTSPLGDIGFFLTEKNGHKLVHSRIREQEVRTVGHQG